MTHFLAALNVVMHPHSPKTYFERFEKAFELQRKSVKLRGDQHGLVASCFRVEPDSDVSPLEGEIFRFTEIDFEAAWFNAESGKVATEDDMLAVNIPSHLRPNLKRFRYVFWPKEHRLVFETNRANDALSPQAAFTLFNTFLNDRRLLVASQPLVELTIEQSREALDEIFALASLCKLEITLNKPNPDDGSEAEDAILKEMESQEVATIEMNLTADKGGSIKPNKRTKNWAKAAMSNGKVVGVGKDANGRKKIQETNDHPYRRSATRKKQPLVEWFRGIAKLVISDLFK